MFTIDIPYAPPLDEPIVLAQAGSATVISTPDFIFKACIETEHTPNDPRSALRGVDPAGMLEIYYLRLGKTINIAEIKTAVLEGPKHGKLTAEIDSTGLVSYRYDPTPGYLGDDSATFMTNYRGRYYKSIVTIKVLRGIDENSPVCPKPQLIKVNKLVSGSFDASFEGGNVTYSDVSGGGLAQTTGTGPTAQITLDTNAAGHGWFIDYTPYLNEEFLPTSNPLEWVAKPGSAAEGKMDLLTVLLHEYGHALGLEHTADAHSLMATTLQPGIRRLPRKNWGQTQCR